jgi:hypothetical protein
MLCNLIPRLCTRLLTEIVAKIPMQTCVPNIRIDLKYIAPHHIVPIIDMKREKQILLNEHVICEKSERF